ncbi:MAG TPA: hypothetical protein VL443_18350 [Cyclobacteriaceae bacterium]|jgi:hypothetical protein|nr:hypothetical protein [Cyclobacteriaceae bacterium]
MKSLFNKVALSARREVTNQIKVRVFNAGTLGLPIITLTLLLISCHGNTNGQHAELKNKQTDSLQKPKVDIKVNRRYDEKGNMIGFDSTYTSYYSNINGDTSRMDSVMDSFDHYFKQGHSTFFSKQFDPLFFTDSTRYPDFFHDDFFLKRYELNDPYLRSMMHRMDSIKNKFYEEQHKASKKPTH